MELSKLLKPQILKLNSYKPGKSIKEVKREFKIDNIIKLASNENPIGPSKKVLKTIRDKVSSINRYPDAACLELREELSNFYDRFNTDNFIIGNGSNEIIELVLRAFLNPGEEVISCKPTFLIYNLSAVVEGGKYISVPLDENFEYDLEGIIDKVTDETKVIFISNPNNPTGNYIKKDEIIDFLNRLPKHVIVVLDEAYKEFVDEEDVSWDKNILKNNPLIIARTFSKAYGLSGLRIGYGIADEGLINYLNRVRQPFNVNMLAQKAAVFALRDRKHLKKVQKLILEQKEYIYSELKKLELDFIKSQTNFVLINVNRESYEIYNQMLKRGVIVRPMKEYGLDNFIRVTIGLPKENSKFIETLSKIL